MDKKLIKYFFTLVTIVFLAIFSKTVVKAMTINEMQILINQLQTQILQLQQQLAAKNKTWCHNFNVNLNIYLNYLDKGEEVIALQTALFKEGLLAENKITGNFDKNTVLAVINFKNKYKKEILTSPSLLRVNSSVGENTRAKLNKLYGCSKTTISSSTTVLFNVPVLVLNYFPLDKNDSTKIDLNITGPYLEMGTTLKQIMQKTNRINSELISGLEKGSSYHGYKNSNSQPVLKYSIFETKEFLRPIFRTNNSSWIFPDNGDWGFTADHFNELSNLNICDYAENKGIKEVWIWMYHYAPDLDSDGKADQDANRYHVSPTESNMAGPYGDISNSYRINDLPVCKKTYTVYEYNYTRDFGEAIEDHTHQMEAIFGYVDNNTFWNKFVGGTTEPFGCGWTHCPPNVMSQCSSHNYDWNNQMNVISDCEDWKKYRTGETKTIGCNTWASGFCDNNSKSGDKFKVWWMQNIPKDWWIYLGDFDKAMTEKISL